MHKVQHLSHNAALSATELMDIIAGNIASSGKRGYRAKRWSFNDYMIGGTVEQSGFSTKQGQEEPRIGEWTKMMIKGKGFFTVQDPRSHELMYTRLGDFHIDGQGNLVSQEGFAVQGTPLAAGVTTLRGPDPTKPNPYQGRDLSYDDPFNNPVTNNAQELNEAGQAVGQAQTINLKLDPQNGKYLGHFSSIKVGEDGVIYGKDGNNLVSLFKISVANFNNEEGLNDVREGVYFQASAQSGFPTHNASESTVIGEALEKNNVFMKAEISYLTDAQRYYQAATQLHKLSDKITGTAIEMIQ